MVIQEIHSYMGQIRHLDSKRGALERLVKEIEALVKEFEKGDTSKQDQIVARMDQAIRIIKESFVDLEKLMGLLNELLIVDIELAEQKDKTTLGYLFDAITKMYHADQAIRFSGSGGIVGIKSFYFGTILGGHSGEYKSMNGLQVDHYNQVRLIKLLQIHPLNTIKNRKILHSIWLIVQHMDRNLTLQRELFEQFRRNPYALPRDVAYLYDRTLKNSGQPLWFGTQNDEPTNVYAMRHIKDAEVKPIRMDEHGNPVYSKDKKGNEYGELTEASIHMVSERLHAYGLPSIDKQYQGTVRKNRIKKIIGRALMFRRIQLIS